jgi:hypothetical protein
MRWSVRWEVGEKREEREGRGKREEERRTYSEYILVSFWKPEN